MKIIGLDIGKLSVTGTILSEKPTVPRVFWRSGDFFSLKLSAASISFLVEMTPDVVILEPTGTHYSRPWIRPLMKAGIDIRLVGHDKLHAYRIYLDLPSKNDRADALALACYGFDYLDETSRFVPVRPFAVERMRDISLRLQFYSKMRTQFLNRLKHDLVECFPEKALYRTDKPPGGNPPPLWRWLAGEDIGKAKRAKYTAEISASLGLGINSDISEDSAILLSIFRREQSLEIEMAEILKSEIFAKYLPIFENFGFGLRISGIFLSQIYPIEKFMGSDGLPEVRREMGQNGITSRYLSIRRFRSMMGLAPQESSSGAKMKSRKSGNRLCRRTWWQWCLTSLEPKNKRKTEILQILGKDLDKMKDQGLPIQKARIKICAKACDKLFKELAVK